MIEEIENRGITILITNDKIKHGHSMCARKKVILKTSNQ